MIPFTEQRMLEIQTEWQLLDRQDKILAQTIRNLSTYSEQLYDSEEYTDTLDEIGYLEYELGEIRKEKRIRLTWLLSGIAQEWSDL